MSSSGKIGALVLAAGASRRFGEDNKLLAQVDGKALIDHVLDALSSARVAPVIVVTGWDADSIAQLVKSREVRLVHNASWDAGMGGSIAAGVAALDADLPGALIVPGDMPLLTSGVVAALIDAFEKSDCNGVVYPATQKGEQRNPVLWPRRFFAELEALAAAEGAKSLLQRLGSSDRRAVVVEDERVFLDVDTQSELGAVRGA